jgi:hypothetical protein
MPLTDSEIPDTEVQPKSRGSALKALGWASACAACAGCVWALAHTLLTALGSPTLSEWYLKLSVSESFPVTAAAAGAGGLLGGFCVWLNRAGTSGSQALVLAVVAAAFGATAGALVGPVSVACSEWMPRSAASAFVWAVAGFSLGLSGYAISRWKTHTAEEFDEEDKPPRGPIVQWLLRECKRRLFDRALLRVLPVLLVTMWALGGAALLAPDDVAIALLAVGVLGLSVSLVLYRQEERLESLEQRLRDRRES